MCGAMSHRRDWGHVCSTGNTVTNVLAQFQHNSDEASWRSTHVINFNYLKFLASAAPLLSFQTPQKPLQQWCGTHFSWWATYSLILSGPD